MHRSLISGSTSEIRVRGHDPRLPARAIRCYPREQQRQTQPFTRVREHCRQYTNYSAVSCGECLNWDFWDEWDVWDNCNFYNRFFEMMSAFWMRIKFIPLIIPIPKIPV